MSTEAIEQTEVPPSSQPVTSTNNKLDVNSELFDPFAIAAADGRAFIWSTRHDSSDNDHALYLRNIDPDNLLRIVDINTGGKSECVFTLNAVTGDGNGSDSNEFNMDFSATAALAVHKEDDVGNLGTPTPIAYRTIPDFGETVFELKRALALGFNEAITVQISKGSDDTVVSIMGFYEE